MTEHDTVRWLNHLGGDIEGIVLTLPIKKICYWDQDCSPTGHWLIRRDVKAWLDERSLKTQRCYGACETLAYIRFDPEQNQEAVLFKLTWG